MASLPVLELVEARPHGQSRSPLHFDFASLLTCWPDIRTDKLWTTCRLAEVKTRLLLLAPQPPSRLSSRAEGKNPRLAPRSLSDIDLPPPAVAPRASQQRRHSFTECALSVDIEPVALSEMVPPARLSSRSVREVLHAFKRFTSSSVLSAWAVGNNTVVRTQTRIDAAAAKRASTVGGVQSSLSDTKRPTSQPTQLSFAIPRNRSVMSKPNESQLLGTNGGLPELRIGVSSAEATAIGVTQEIASNQADSRDAVINASDSTDSLLSSDSKTSITALPSPSTSQEHSSLSLAAIESVLTPIVPQTPMAESVDVSEHPRDPSSSTKEPPSKNNTPLRNVPDSIVFTRPLDLLLPRWDYFRYFTTSLPFISFLLVSMLSWFATQLFQHYDDPLLVAYYLVAFFFTAFSPLLTTEKKLIRPLLKSFEFNYLLLNVFLFVGAGAYALQTAVGTYTAISFGVIAFISLVVLTMVDFFPRLSHGSSRAFISVCCMVTCAYTVLNDRLHFDNNYDSHNLCSYFIYCVDTKRVMYSSAVTLFLYNGKYLVQFLSDVRNNRNSFIVNKTPIVSESADVCFPSDPRTGRPGLSALRIIRVTLDIPTDFRDYFGSPMSELREVEHSKPQSANELTNRPVARPYHEFLFGPLNPFQWMHRVATSRIYQGFWIILIAAGVAVLAFPAAPDSPVVVRFFSIMAILGALTLFFEATRIDRSLFSSLIRRFEFYIVLYNSGAYAFFAALSAPNVVEGIPPMICWFFIAFGLTIIDTAPSYPPFVRKTIVVLLLINSVRVFYLDRFDDVVLFEDREFCLLFCASTRVMTLTALFNSTLFFAKYTWSIFGNPRRFIILKVRLRYLVEQRLVGKDGEGRVKQVTDVTAPLVPVTGFFNFKTPSRFAESYQRLKAQLNRVKEEAMPFISRSEARLSVTERPKCHEVTLSVSQQ